MNLHRITLSLVASQLLLPPLQALSNNDVPQVGEKYDSDATINYNINYGTGKNQIIVPPNGAGGAAGQQQVDTCGPEATNCFSGVIFNKSSSVTLNNNATLTLNVDGAGAYRSYAAALFRGTENGNYSVNGNGTLVVNLNSLPKSGDGLEGVFMTQRTFGKRSAGKFNFNTDLIVRASSNFYIQRGIFTANGPANGVNGEFRFNKNVDIDISKMKKSDGWGNGAKSGVGFRMMFSIEQTGKAYINYDPDKKTTANKNNVIKLKGDVSVEASSREDGAVILHLTNPESFLQGRFSLLGSADAQLLLEDGGKWFLLANSGVRTLKILNSANRIQNQYVDVDKIAVVDFVRIDDDAHSFRLKNPQFKERTLQVHTELSGANGVFRLMADVPQSKADLINVTGTLKSTNYIQIYQNGRRASIDVNTKIKVAHANKTEGGDFLPLTSSAGIYDYTPTLIKETEANAQNNGVDQNAQGANGNGTAWYLVGLKREANQTAKSLFNILSGPYNVYRLLADNLNHRVDDLLYPPTRFGVWVKAYGGGLYRINEFDPKDKKELNSHLLHALQGGVDTGRNEGNSRVFYGGEVGRLSIYSQDLGHNGNGVAYSFGAYGGLIDDDQLFIDGKVKYAITNFKNSMHHIEGPVDFTNNMLIADLRLGYNIYPYRNRKKRTIEIAVKGDDGSYFYRNAKDTGYVRDPRFYIQPFVQLTPGAVFGNQKDLTDRISKYSINAKLDFAPAFITKVGAEVATRFDFFPYSAMLKAHMNYAYDINRGGRITLVDDTQLPLRTNTESGDHRVQLGARGEFLVMNDSFRLFGGFNTEFFGYANSYWMFNAGIRYKFGQPIIYKKPTLSYRPKSPRPKQTIFNSFDPYKKSQDPNSNTFKSKNHFVQQKNGYIRPR